MTEASVSFAGNLTDQPELRHTQAGSPAVRHEAGYVLGAWRSLGSTT